MSMTIKDVCLTFSDGDWIESKDQSNCGIRLVQTGNIGNGEYLDKKDRAKYISDDTFSRLNCTEIFPGDILVSRLPDPIGRACIIPDVSDRMITAVDCTICRPDESIVLKEYLCYYMQSNAYFSRLMNSVTGTTRKRISRSNLGSVEVPVPDKTTQINVIERFDRLKTIIRAREEEITKLDNLIKARFVELFGDLDKNDKGWIERPLIEVCNQLKRYPTFCNMEYLEQGTRVIRIGNILIDGHMDVDDNNYVFVYDDVNSDFPDTVIELHDIVMAVRGDGSAAKRIGIIQENKLIGANISPNLIRIQANTNIVSPVFLFHYLISEVGQKRLDSFVNKTAKKNIAAKDIAKVITPVPDMDIQDEYVEFVKQVDKSKVVAEKNWNIHNVCLIA